MAAAQICALNNLHTKPPACAQCWDPCWCVLPPPPPAADRPCQTAHNPHSPFGLQPRPYPPPNIPAAHRRPRQSNASPFPANQCQYTFCAFQTQFQPPPQNAAAVYAAPWLLCTAPPLPQSGCAVPQFLLPFPLAGWPAPEFFCYPPPAFPSAKVPRQIAALCNPARSSNLSTAQTQTNRAKPPARRQPAQQPQYALPNCPT